MADFRQTFILFMFIGLVIGNPTSRFHPGDLLPGSCTFDSDLCGYTPLSGQLASWFQITTSADNHGIPPSTDGHYAYFKSNIINIHKGDTGSLVSPKLNIDGCINVEFLYILPYTETMTLSIKLQEAGKITLVKDITGINMNKWTTTINNICVIKNTQLIFETTKLGYYAFAGIDNIKVTMFKLATSTIQPTTKLPTTEPPTKLPTTEPTPTTKPPTAEQTTLKPTAEPKSPTSKQPTMSTTEQPTTRRPPSPSTTSTKRSDCFAAEVEKLWYMKDMEKLELEKQKLHDEIKSEMEKSELEKQKLHDEMKSEMEKSELEKQKLHDEMKSEMEKSELEKQKLHDEIKSEMEKSELEKQKLHDEMKSEMEKSELEKQKLHDEIKLLHEQLAQK